MGELALRVWESQHGWGCGGTKERSYSVGRVRTRIKRIGWHLVYFCSFFCSSVVGLQVCAASSCHSGLRKRLVKGLVQTVKDREKARSRERGGGGVVTGGVGRESVLSGWERVKEYKRVGGRLRKEACVGSKKAGAKWWGDKKIRIPLLLWTMAFVKVGCDDGGEGEGVRVGRVRVVASAGLFAFFLSPFSAHFWGCCSHN